jgi:hypothetical protein
VFGAKKKAEQAQKQVSESAFNLVVACLESERAAYDLNLAAQKLLISTLELEVQALNDEIVVLKMEAQLNREG